jgi:hypothetical protein
MRQVNRQFHKTYLDDRLWQEHLPPRPSTSDSNLCLLGGALEMPKAERFMLLKV